MTIAFLGKTGAGKTTLMNSMAKQILGKQGGKVSVKSQTSEITVYPDIPFLKDKTKMVNFVDLPGLLDTKGRDQEIVDNMVKDIKRKCPRIDLFVLCMQFGKFDSGIQDMLKIYENLLDKDQTLWGNMSCIVTKVSFTEDYDEVSEWIEEME